MASYISENDRVHQSTDKKNIIVGKTKKLWMKLPPQLGSKKCNVLDQFETICNCSTHMTTMYVLDGSYCTMHCGPANGWAWIVKPDADSIKWLKEMGIKLTKN